MLQHSSEPVATSRTHKAPVSRLRQVETQKESQKSSEPFRKKAEGGWTFAARRLHLSFEGLVFFQSETANPSRTNKQTNKT